MREGEKQSERVGERGKNRKTACTHACVVFIVVEEDGETQLF